MTAAQDQHDRGKRILITGASGYLATVLTQRLAATECLLVRASRSELPALPADAVADSRIIEADYSSPNFWQDALIDVDIVFHLAAQTSVREAEADRLRDWSANVLPMQLLLSACGERAMQPVVVYTGTATQVGMPRKLPVTTTTADEPLTTYDLHKLTAENDLKLACRQGSIRGVSLRLANVYGPGPAGRQDRGIINQMILRALRGEPLTIYGAGEHTRDYVYIDDVVEALLAAASHVDSLCGQHHYVASGQGITLRDAFHLVADRVQDLVGRTVVIEHIEPPSDLSPIETRDFVADITGLKQACGWTPRTTLPQGIEKTIRYFQRVLLDT